MISEQTVRIPVPYFGSVLKTALLRPMRPVPPTETKLWWITWGILTAGLGIGVAAGDGRWTDLLWSPAILLVVRTRRYWLFVPLWLTFATVHYRRSYTGRSLCISKLPDRILIGQPEQFSLLLIPSLYGYHDGTRSLTIYGRQHFVPILIIPKKLVPDDWVRWLVDSLTEKAPPVLPR